ncbi:hypothetical protein [Aminobacter sp. SS-2016]|jgi:hypothetical protein|uniref:hypothetical protein n=1 Tax=Aminobacter sp. Y103A TaxID=1870862 RepID=UPI0025741764|nr:hypothetical protein [Aminobacter sp. SS-2016]
MATVYAMGLMIVAPLAARLATILLTSGGSHRVISAALTSGTLVVCGYFLLTGVTNSCAIKEGECVGSTATAYLVVVLWLMSAAACLYRVFSVRHPSSTQP